MSYDNYIDSIAAFSKFGIEMSGQLRDEKELAKTRVDCLATLLKLIQPLPKQRLNSLEINFEWTRQIKKLAKQYSVDRVVLFPYSADAQNFIPLLRAYGGETVKFFEEIGFNPLKGNNITSEENAILTQWENEYGIILYDSCRR